MEPKQAWFCAQLGGREHYAVPRALAQNSALAALCTDAWVGGSHPLRFSPWRRLRDRYHRDLAEIGVISWTWESVLRTRLCWQRLPRWERIMAQNAWFGRKAAAALARMEFDPGLIAFSYSYTASPIFKAARHKGCKTILGQIDGGIVEAQIIQRLHKSRPDSGSTWSPAPAAYWEKWREELNLADLVLVNSQWSRKCLDESGFVEKDRIAVVPLAYRPPEASVNFQRHYPSQFSAARPLRVLFLGQVTLRKGVLPIFDAIRALSGLPIEFVFVGAVSVAVPTDLRGHPKVRFAGAVPRSEVAGYYRDADVFIFPTFSDGFGLTQLEAQAWKLPIIASRFCGEVICNGLNGILLPEVTTATICRALQQCLENASLLADFSRNSVAMSNYSLPQLGKKLLAAVQQA